MSNGIIKRRFPYNNIPPHVFTVKTHFHILLFLSPRFFCSATINTTLLRRVVFNYSHSIFSVYLLTAVHLSALLLCHTVCDLMHATFVLLRKHDPATQLQFPATYTLYSAVAVLIYVLNKLFVSVIAVYPCQDIEHRLCRKPRGQFCIL